MNANPDHSFDTILKLAAGEARLHAEMSLFVRPVYVQEGEIHFSLAPGAPTDLVDRMREWLAKAFGFSWSVVRIESGGMSAIERKNAVREDFVQKAKKHPVIADIMRQWPGAMIVVPDDLA